MSASEPTAIVDGRFYLGMGCEDVYRCGRRSWFIVDLETGEVAVALAHAYDDAGRVLDLPHLTVFAMGCVGAPLKAFVTKIADEGSQLRAKDAGRLAADAPKPRWLQARCR